MSKKKPAPRKRSRRTPKVFIEPDGRIRRKPTYSPLELAALIDKSRQHVTRSCERGEIKAEKLGALWLIPWAEVARLTGIAAE
jgi:hypothetical protein